MPNFLAAISKRAALLQLHNDRSSATTFIVVLQRLENMCRQVFGPYNSCLPCTFNVVQLNIESPNRSIRRKQLGNFIVS